MAITRNELNETLDLDRTGRAQGIRVAWGGVWSGFLVASGIFLLLTILGLAIGVTTVGVGDGGGIDVSRISTAAAVWSGVMLLISLFIGGYLSTRTGQVYDRVAGVTEGVLVWVLSVLAIVYMASSGIGALGSAMSGVLGGITQSARSVAGNLDVNALSSGNVDQIVARLREPQTAQIVAAATGIPQTQARTDLDGIAQQVEAARNNPAQAAAAARSGLESLMANAGQRVEKAAAAAQPYAKTAMWSTFIVMVIALIVSVLGSMLGRRQVARRLREVI